MSSCCVLPQLQVIAATIISNIISRGAQVDLAPGSCCHPGCSCRHARRQRCPQRGLNARAPWPHWGRPATRACAACCPQGPTCMRPQCLCRLRVPGRLSDAAGQAAAYLHSFLVSSSHLCPATVHDTQRSYGGPHLTQEALLGQSTCGRQQLANEHQARAARAKRSAASLPPRLCPATASRARSKRLCSGLPGSRLSSRSLSSKRAVKASCQEAHSQLWPAA